MLEGGEIKRWKTSIPLHLGMHFGEIEQIRVRQSKRVELCPADDEGCVCVAASSQRGLQGGNDRCAFVAQASLLAYDHVGSARQGAPQ